MTEEHDVEENVFNPIEGGKTFQLPEVPEEGDQVFADHYRLRCDHIDIQPKSIVLPKFIFNPGMGYKEKGPLLLGFDSDHVGNIFGKILLAAEKGFRKFYLDFLNDEETEILSTWSFEGARVQAVDFGFVAKARPSPAELAIEIDYKHLVIGDTSI